MRPAVALGPFLLSLLGLALAVLALFWFYAMVNRAFRRVGFTSAEAGLILVATFLLSGLDIPVWPTPVGGGWVLAVNVGGAVVPVAVSFWLLRRIPSMAMPALVGTVIVTIATYLVTRVEPFGIAVPLGLALVPPLAAAAMSLTAFWREEDHAAPLAYVCGTFGAILGADVLRVWEFLQQPAPEPGAVASIGGAAVFDMVYLTGIVAVGLDALAFRRRDKEKAGASLPYAEPEVFTVGTSPERMAAWSLPKAPRPMAVRGEYVEARPQSVRTVVREPSLGVERPQRVPTLAEHARAQERQTAPPPSASSDDARLAQHRSWEEQMRRRRGS